MLLPLGDLDRPSTARPLRGPARIAGATIDARASIITTDGTDAAFDAIRSAPQYLGAPFDVLNATTGPTLTADTLASGTHGKYDAVFLDFGGLETGTGSVFTSDEWTAPSTYEAEFSVRRVALDTSPSSAYGLADVGSSIRRRRPSRLPARPQGRRSSWERTAPDRS